MKLNLTSPVYWFAQCAKRIATVFLLLMLMPAYAADEQTLENDAQVQVLDDGDVPVPNDQPTPVATAPNENVVQVNPITQAFAQSGVQRCLGRIEQITAFLTNNSSASAGFLFVPPAQQDNSMLSTSMEIVSGDVSSYASASYHPRQTADNCGGLYETVTYWQSSCADLAVTQYATLPKADTLQTKISMLDGGPNMRIFLMSAGTGCVAIKKEVIY